MTSESPGAVRSRWMITGVVVVLLVLSLLIRFRNFSSPLTEDHSFRQTQTAITVWMFLTEGIHPLAYQTPVFGPPWRLPLEFPVFQIIAALAVRVGVTDIDVACRLTNLLFFYLSAWFLYKLCRQHTESTGVSVCILLTYVWLPFTIFWSRTSMIDYASVAFALAYLEYFSRWLRRQNATYLALAVAFGSLAFLTKVTTVPIVAVTMAYLGWQALRAAAQDGLPILRGRKRFLIGLLIIATVPLAVGTAWTEYADAVRRGSPATEWLSARNLNPWNFGTWSQRTTSANWALIWSRLEGTFLPQGFLAFAVLGVLRAVGVRGTAGAFVSTMVLGAVAAVAIFFNLYCVHNYYLMAISPAVAVVAGFGFHWLCFRLMPYQRARLIVALIFLALWQWKAQPYLERPFSISYENDLVYAVGRAIAGVTAPDERIIVEGHTWSPDYLYYARRKGLMWYGSVVTQTPESLEKIFASDRFTTIVCLGGQSVTARFWPRHELVQQIGAVTIYKVSK